MLKKHWFQQDNASPHTKVLRDGWFEEKDVETVDWPAHSPDLNVIETVWAGLERQVSQRGPSSVEEIRSFVMQAWKNVPQSELSELCEEFDDRLRVCIAENGAIVTRSKLRKWRADAACAAGKKTPKTRRRRKN